ncbi:hypothetical protein [Ornatilinea apprima]|uniref:hypothetical protein n=1 Tax=Ornatilinea apprima TaxID=1134406 RepID=UPI000946744B|nr:hypothetical protein [Ornatilinea apprima]
MPLIHTLASYIKGDGEFSGLSGIQADQRDFSPFLVHFTSYMSMEILRRAIELEALPKDIHQLLSVADNESMNIVRRISESNSLLSSKPKNKDGTEQQISKCICFSECNISGIISHAERYGRFGFIFSKSVLFGLGCRPCLYVDEEIYTIISKNFSSDDITTPTGRLYSLANIYTPPGHGKVQDFTHEREWRLFQDLSFDVASPIMLITPSQYASEVSRLFDSVDNIIPLNYLYQMGA